METHRWGDYEITEVLGKGGMGIVYKGRQISLDRPVAIKVLPGTLTEKKDFVERFYREAKSVAKINCPQIIQVYGAGEFEGKHYFAMEFVEGDDISVRIKNGEEFDLPRILHISRSSVVTCCYRLLPVVTGCYMLCSGVTGCAVLLHLVTSCAVLLRGVQCCYLLLQVVTCCYRLREHQTFKIYI